ncbi:hypothetical protein HPB50_007319 [Hyalomma asiaticum]|uniref:Uncharacterized protein n=1 Tax=Hyalomma asiaticum TaxID=266040 RepID=A0ACB7SVY5_HYAAI|nr:hypothetical protein HPB50_007319 [Hyalomma asiaticum]
MTSRGRLKRVRETLKVSVSRIITLLMELLQKHDAEAREAHDHVNFLQIKEADLRQLDTDILDITKDEAVDDELESFADNNEKLLNATADAEFALSEREESFHISDPVMSALYRRQVSASRDRSAALPRLQVPTYSGYSLHWKEFGDCCSATIDKCPEFPPIERFKYLMTCLTQAAEREIEGVRLCDSNYEIVFKTLSERFARKELQVSEHVEEHSHCMHPVNSSKNVEEIRRLLNTVLFHVCALEVLGGT